MQQSQNQKKISEENNVLLKSFYYLIFDIFTEGKNLLKNLYHLARDLMLLFLILITVIVVLILIFEMIYAGVYIISQIW